jgi:hypothetical protein
MRIGATGRSGPVAASRNAGGATGASGKFRLDNAGGGHATGGASGPRSLTSIDSLLAIQEAPDPLARKKKAIRRGTDMLDMLDDMKIGLLSGTISESELARLMRTVEDQRGEIPDPALAGILDEIELRARVELAKHGRIAA